MADLNAASVEPQPDSLEPHSCCAPEQQQDCCGPQDKAACCEPDSSRCACAEGSAKQGPRFGRQAFG
jgi:hypothetical protein